MLRAARPPNHSAAGWVERRHGGGDERSRGGGGAKEGEKTDVGESSSRRRYVDLGEARSGDFFYLGRERNENKKKALVCFNR